MKNTAVKQFFRDDVYSRAFLRMARYATAGERRGGGFSSTLKTTTSGVYVSVSIFGQHFARKNLIYILFM